MNTSTTTSIAALSTLLNRMAASPRTGTDHRETWANIYAVALERPCPAHDVARGEPCGTRAAYGSASVACWSRAVGPTASAGEVLP